MQNAKCKMPKAECQMQNAKCQMAMENAKRPTPGPAQIHLALGI
jgi:hypothetical protein